MARPIEVERGSDRLASRSGPGRNLSGRKQVAHLPRIQTHTKFQSGTLQVTGRHPSRASAGIHSRVDFAQFFMAQGVPVPQRRCFLVKSTICRSVAPGLGCGSAFCVDLFRLADRRPEHRPCAWAEPPDRSVR
jgi:hypothetical protein